MALTDTQIADHLVSFYKSRGVDMTHVLRDPLFTSLPASVKIDAIKRHAGYISDQTPPTWNQEEKIDAGISTVNGMLAGIGAAGAAVQLARSAAKQGSTLANAMKSNKALAITIGMGAVGGLVAGGMLGYLKNQAAHDSRLATRAQLLKVKQDPNNVTHSVGVLSTQALDRIEHPVRYALLDRVTKEVENRLQTTMKEDLGRTFKSESQMIADKMPAPTPTSAPRLPYYK